MSTQQQQSPRSNRDNALAFAHRIVDSFFACFQPFLRRKSGRESPGVSGIFALGILFVVGGFDRTRVMWLYMAVWFIAIIVRRVETLRIPRGQLHSHYGGYPYVAMWMPFVRDENTAQAIVEPLILFVVGLLSMPLSEVFGKFTMLCAAMALVRFVISYSIVTRRVHQMIDAKIEGEFYAGQMREGE